MTIPQLHAEVAKAHVELLSAQTQRCLCAAAFSGAEVVLAEACRKRYLANRALDEALFKQVDFEI